MIPPQVYIEKVGPKGRPLKKSNNWIEGKSGSDARMVTARIENLKTSINQLNHRVKD